MSRLINRVNVITEPMREVILARLWVNDGCTGLYRAVSRQLGNHGPRKRRTPLTSKKAAWRVLLSIARAVCHFGENSDYPQIVRVLAESG